MRRKPGVRGNSGTPNPEETGLCDRDEDGQCVELGAGNKVGYDLAHRRRRLVRRTQDDDPAVAARRIATNVPEPAIEREQQTNGPRRCRDDICVAGTPRSSPVTVSTSCPRSATRTSSATCPNVGRRGRFSWPAPACSATQTGQRDGLLRNTLRPCQVELSY